jgi:methylthioribose-1-phosphate isomerase
LNLDFYNQRTIEWNDKKNCVTMIDQTKLPLKLQFIECRKVSELIRAIKTMQIRGAPAIGVAGAMGVALAVNSETGASTRKALLARINSAVNSIKKARPTAVNLAWGVDQAKSFIEKEFPEEIADGRPFESLVRFVKSLADEDVENNKKLSLAGSQIIRQKASVLTHCN